MLLAFFATSKVTKEAEILQEDLSYSYHTQILSRDSNKQDRQNNPSAEIAL